MAKEQSGRRYDGVSFVVPARNEEELIGRCLLSIRDSAKLSGYPFEIIVVDNGSTDRTVSEAQHFGADRIVPESRPGVTWARQAGLDRARYEVIASIDADSVVAPTWVSEALAVMARPRVVAVSGPLWYEGMSAWSRALVHAYYFAALPLHHYLGPMFQGGNGMLDAKTLRCAGGFDTSIRFYGEDTKTAQRLARYGKVVFTSRLAQLSSPRRLDSEGMLRTAWRYTLNYFWVSLTGRPWSLSHVDVRN